MSTRPWQHVLEPLTGYIYLAQSLLSASSCDSAFTSSFNFGPDISSNRTVEDLIQCVLELWPGSWTDVSQPNSLHEASFLNLSLDKSFHKLGFSSRWGFKQTVFMTISWYQNFYNGTSALDCCLSDRKSYLDYDFCS